MEIQRGFRDKLENIVNVNEPFTIELSTQGGSVYDCACISVDGSDKVSDESYFIFYNQPSSPQNEIIMKDAGSGVQAFQIDLSKLPEFINKLVFTVSIDGDGTMRAISSHSCSVIQDGEILAQMTLSGADFKEERAIISIEIYRKGVFRISAVGRGFNGGLSELLKHYGGTENVSPQESSSKKTASAPDASAVPQTSPHPKPEPKPQPISEPKPPEQPHKPVILKKGEKVKLKKEGAPAGEISINLNWSRPQKKRGFFAPAPQAVDLDLGCLYKLKDGSKGVVQALGKCFGSLSSPPYISLDGDDRTGDIAKGETLRVNGHKVSEIDKILVFTFIYEGVTNWKSADGVVTLKCPGSPELIIKMDEYSTNKRMCALALLENDGNKTFTVEKLIRFFNGHSDMDKAFGWGMRWTPGRK